MISLFENELLHELVTSIRFQPTYAQISFYANDGTDKGLKTKLCRPFNFGSIGSIIGHELMHTFDKQGRLYDENGNLNEWWQPEALQMFDSKSECFIRQYSNYTYDNIPVKNLF